MIVFETDLLRKDLTLYRALEMLVVYAGQSYVFAVNHFGETKGVFRENEDIKNDRS